MITSSRNLPPYHQETVEALASLGRLNPTELAAYLNHAASPELKEAVAEGRVRYTRRLFRGTRLLWCLMVLLNLVTVLFLVLAMVSLLNGNLVVAIGAAGPALAGLLSLAGFWHRIIRSIRVTLATGA